MNSKKIATIALGTFMTINLILPVFAFAQTENETPASKGFCTRASEITSKIDQQFANRFAKLEVKRQEILSKLGNLKDERDTRRTENRAEWNTNYQEHYAKLEARATTDAQKQTVTAFKVMVEAAIAARKAIVDAAIQAFRSGIEQVITNRKLAIDAAISAFRSSVSAAIEKVKSDCASLDSKTVRETFRQSMKTALDKFKSDRQAIEKLYTSIEPLHTARKEAINKAIQDFKAVMEKARVDLKAAFGQ